MKLQMYFRTQLLQKEGKKEHMTVVEIVKIFTSLLVKQISPEVLQILMQMISNTDLNILNLKYVVCGKNYQMRKWPTV